MQEKKAVKDSIDLIDFIAQTILSLQTMLQGKGLTLNESYI